MQRKIFAAILLIISTIIFAPTVNAAENLIYSDNLTSGWQNWSWGSGVNFDSSQGVLGKDIELNLYSWGALYLHSDAGISASSDSNLTFDLKSSQNNQKLQLSFYDGNNQLTSSFKSLASYGGETSTNWKNYSIPLSQFNASQKQIKGLAIQDATGQNQQTIFIDNIKFVDKNLAPVPQPIPSSSCPVNNSCCSQPIQKCTANGRDSSCPQGYQWCYAGYCVNENYSPSNNSCPGFQPTPTTSPTPVPTATPTPTQAPTVAGYTTANNKIFYNNQQIKLKGISWFGFETGTHVAHGLWSRNWKDVIGQMKSLGFNSVRVPFCPATLQGVATTSIDAGKNPDLVGLNSLQVLDKVLQEMNNQGLYILLDHHTPDCNTISQFWHANGYSENDWISDLKFVSQRYKHLPYFMGLDIKNEPHGGATWGTGNTGTDWNLAAEKAGKEVLNVNPNILVFVQGIQENSDCSSNIAHWMGGNLEPFNCKPIATSFIPANKLILSPHVYGPDVYFQGYFNDGNFPNNMPEIWEKHFGNLVNKGLSVVPGEWGGKYGNGGQAKDKIWQDSFVNYMKSKNICSSYYWSFNPNSGDTGGILKDDWNSVWDNKMNLLRDYFNSCN